MYRRARPPWPLSKDEVAEIRQQRAKQRQLELDAEAVIRRERARLRALEAEDNEARRQLKLIQALRREREGRQRAADVTVEMADRSKIARARERAAEKVAGRVKL